MSIYNFSILLAYIFEIIVAWHYFKSIFSLKFKPSLVISLILVGYLCAFLSFLLFDFIFNAIIFFTINFILCFMLFTAGLKESIFHVSIISAVMFGTEVLSLFLCQLIFKFDILPYEEPLLTSIASIISKFLYFIFLQLLSSLFTRKKIKDTNQSSFKVTWYLWLTPLATFVMYFVFFEFGLTVGLSNKLQFLIAAVCILFLFANILIFLSYQHNQNLNQKVIETQTQLVKETTERELYQTLNEQNESQHILIHDIKNHLNILKSYAQNNSTSELFTYLNKIETSDIFKTNMEFCNNNTLNLILSRYNSLFKKSDISVSFILDPTSLNFVDDYDITSLIGNLLENSYEATKNIDTRFVDFSILYESNSNSTFVKVINSCNLDKVNRKSKTFFTSKTNTVSHGYGLKSVTKVIEKYNGTAEFYVDESDSSFHSFMIIPNTKKDII